MAYIKCLKGLAHVIPNGKTVTPTDDVQIWLHCANIWDKDYTRIVQVASDLSTLFQLCTTNNSIDYLKRSKGWRNYLNLGSLFEAYVGCYDYCADTLLSDVDWCQAILIDSPYWANVYNTPDIPKMTSNTAPSGECYASDSYSSNPPYYAFDQTASTYWASNSTGSSSSVGYKYPSAHKMHYGRILRRNASSYASLQYTCKYQYSIDGTNWVDATELATFNLNGTSADQYIDTPIGEVQSARYWRLYSTAPSGGRSVCAELQFYGRDKGGVQDWLRAGGITDKTYYSISNVCSDSTTLATLIASTNACDYLVTAKGFIQNGICENQAFMTALGINDYASNLLLSDPDWCEAISSSAYADYVLNVKVPTMTSDTQPSGLAFSYQPASGYYAFQAFDGNDTGCPFASSGGATVYVGYKYTKDVKAYFVKFKARRMTSWKVYSGDNQASYTEIASGAGHSDTGATYYDHSAVISDHSAHNTYKLEGLANNGYAAFARVQFYGRDNAGVQEWLTAGGITDKHYASLDALLADTTTLTTLIASQSACAYLVTATGFIGLGICNNQDFMSILGQNNYAANLLLNDEDWYNAIKSSTYASSVITVTVPKMTGATTPSGEAYASSYATNYAPWKAFSQSTSYTTCWSWSGSGAVANNAWLAYDFGSAVRIFGVMWMNRTTTQATRPAGTLIVQGSNDKSTWTDVSGTLTGSATASASFNYHFTNTNAYRHYRVLITSTAVSGDTNLIIQQLQFYGRADV